MKCKVCKKANAVNGITRCQPCRIKYNLAVHKYSVKMNNLGLCASCQSPRNKYKWVCDNCAKKNVENGKKLANKRKTMGLCRECPKPIVPDKKVCMGHYFQEMSGHMLGTMTRWEEFVDLYTLQNGKCFYCLDELNYKIESDHFMPICLFPELAKDINNLVLSCINCNQSKKDLLPMDYINHCKKVAMVN